MRRLSLGRGEGLEAFEAEQDAAPLFLPRAAQSAARLDVGWRVRVERHAACEEITNGED